MLGGANFTLIGRPLLDPKFAHVRATVIEKVLTLSISIVYMFNSDNHITRSCPWLPQTKCAQPTLWVIGNNYQIISLKYFRDKPGIDGVAHQQHQCWKSHLGRSLIFRSFDLSNLVLFLINLCENGDWIFVGFKREFWKHIYRERSNAW